MKERIKELVEQATEHDYTTWDSYNQKELVYYKFNKEKFAELIVRECMAQIQTVREIKAGHAGPEYNQAFDDGMFVAISTIEEHFGVE